MVDGRVYIHSWSGLPLPQTDYSSPISVSTTTLADSTPPSVALVVSVTDVGSTYVSLTWTASQDDGPFLFYEVSLNGAPYANVSNRSATIPFLNSQTTYTRSMSGRDCGVSTLCP